MLTAEQAANADLLREVNHHQRLANSRDDKDNTEEHWARRRMRVAESVAAKQQEEKVGEEAELIVALHNAGRRFALTVHLFPDSILSKIVAAATSPSQPYTYDEWLVSEVTRIQVLSNGLCDCIEEHLQEKLAKDPKHKEVSIRVASVSMSPLY
jgi:hypothetical protein